MSTSWPSTVIAELQLQDGQAQDWLSALSTSTAPSGNPLPTAAEVVDRLEHMGADKEDVQAILRVLPECDRPGVRWAIGRCRQQLIDAMGNAEAEVPGWPALPGEFGRYFYAFVFLATVPEVREYHTSRGIDEQTSWASLADLTQQLRVHRRIFGIGGLHTQEWLKLPFRGLLYSLGRLQFNFYRFGSKAVAGKPFEPNEPVIGTHIPETGPLDTDECIRSFERAREFFGKHFPELPIRYAMCGSWLLDPQLTEYLRPESNIVRFQRLFKPIERETPGNKDVLEFVFRKVGEVDLDTLPQNTSLERAVVTHLRSGRDWHLCYGWRAL